MITMKTSPACSETNIFGSRTAKIGIRMPSVVWWTNTEANKDARQLLSAKRNSIAITAKRFDYHTLVKFYKIHTKLAPSYLASLLPISLLDQDTALENFFTVSQLYQKPPLSTLSSLEQLLCGMLYLLMFSKPAQSMHLRSFSHHILKYKPSTTLLCLFFSSSFCFFLLFVFFCLYFLLSLFFSLPVLLVMPHTSHLQERSPTSIGLLFLKSCLNICL